MQNVWFFLKVLRILLWCVYCGWESEEEDIKLASEARCAGGDMGRCPGTLLVH